MLCTSFAQIAMFFAFLSDVSGQMRGQGGELGPKSRKIITRVGQNSYKHSFTVAMKVMMMMMMTMMTMMTMMMTMMTMMMVMVFMMMTIIVVVMAK